MPYRKKKSPYASRRPGYSSCGRMVVSDAKKALVMASHLKRLVNVEIKNFDVQQTAVAITTTPVIVQLSNIPQGDTNITRDGAQCKVLSLELGLQLTPHVNGAITGVRILVVCDKQTNGSIYTNSDLLADVTVNDNMASPYNLDNKFRFQILWDKRFNLATNNRSNASFTKRFKMSKVLRFDGSTPSIADLTSMSLSLVQFTNEPTNTPLITMFSRLHFVDN